MRDLSHDEIKDLCTLKLLVSRYEIEYPYGGRFTKAWQYENHIAISFVQDALAEYRYPDRQKMIDSIPILLPYLLQYDYWIAQAAKPEYTNIL